VGFLRKPRLEAAIANCYGIEELNGFGGDVVIFVFEEAESARTALSGERESHPAEAFGEGSDLSDAGLGDFEGDVAQEDSGRELRHVHMPLL
jgi:hypothetical protein